MKEVRIRRRALEVIQEEAERAYPREGCGALLGVREGEIQDVKSLANRDEGSPRTRFSVSSLDYIAVEEEAESRGLKLLGFWHSHPDHPARPSATDRKFAWEGLLTLVVSVEGGVSRRWTAWDVDGAGFEERELVTHDD